MAKQKKDTSHYPEYVQRMIAEGTALRKNIYALAGYLDSDAGKALPKKKKQLMSKQLGEMRSYSDTLTMRVQLEEKEL